MMNNFINTIIVAGLFFALGAAVIGLIWYLQNLSKRSRSSSKNNAPDDANLSEVVRLMRHLQTQELVVQIDGKNFDKPSELSNAQHRRVSFTSTVLVKWLAQPGPDPSSEGNDAEPAAPKPIIVETVDPKPEYTPPFPPDAMGAVEPVSTSLPDVVTGIINPTSAPAPAFISIAMQINEILQAQLAGTALEPRGITLVDSPSGGVIVTLDGKHYDGPMDVPDHEVRNAIRLAVKEWETRK